MSNQADIRLNLIKSFLARHRSQGSARAVPRYPWVPGYRPVPIEILKIWVPLGTGYRGNFKNWVPLGTGYQANFRNWVPLGTGYRANFESWVPLGTGYRANFRSWVPLGTGYRANFRSWVPLGTGYRANFGSWVPLGTGYRKKFRSWVPLGTAQFLKRGYRWVPGIEKILKITNRSFLCTHSLWDIGVKQNQK